MATSKRHWIQFRLRTLLVAVAGLAVVCGCIGWQLKIVRERTAWLANRPQNWSIAGSVQIRIRFGNVGDSPSMIRRWLGDEPREWIVIKSRSDAQSATRLFPEATISYSDEDEPETGSPFDFRI